MSKMSNLAIELDEADIDYRIVDFEVVEAYQQAYHTRTGHKLTVIEAIKHIYGK